MFWFFLPGSWRLMMDYCPGSIPPPTSERLSNWCDSADGAQKMQWCVSFWVSVWVTCWRVSCAASHASVSFWKWGHLLPSVEAFLFFFFLSMQFPHLHAKSERARITEVCECNWPWLNLDLLLVFQTCTLDIPPTKALQEILWVPLVLALWLHCMSVLAVCFKVFDLQETSR